MQLKLGIGLETALAWVLMLPSACIMLYKASEEVNVF